MQSARWWAADVISTLYTSIGVSELRYVVLEVTLVAGGQATPLCI